MSKYVEIICKTTSKSAVFHAEGEYLLDLESMIVKSDTGYNFTLTEDFSHDSEYGQFTFVPCEVYQVVTDRANIFQTMDQAISFAAKHIYISPVRRQALPNEINNRSLVWIVYGFNTVTIEKIINIRA